MIRDPILTLPEHFIAHAAMRVAGIPVLDDLYVNVTGDTMTGSLVVDLGSDVEGIRIQGNATQTADLLTIEKSDGTDLMRANGDGRLLLSPDSGFAPIAITGSGANVACTGLNAAQVDGYEGTELAVLAENETVTGNWRHTGSITMDDAGGDLIFDTDGAQTWTINDIGGTDNLIVGTSGSGTFLMGANFTVTGFRSRTDTGFTDTALLSAPLLATNGSGDIVTAPAGSSGDLYEYTGSAWAAGQTLSGNYTLDAAGTALTVTNNVDINGVLAVGSSVAPDSNSSLYSRFDMTGAPSGAKAALRFFANDAASSTLTTLYAVRGEQSCTGSRANKRISAFQATQRIESSSSGAINRMRLFDTDQVGDTGATNSFAGANNMTGWRANVDIEDLASVDYDLIHWTPAVDTGATTTVNGLNFVAPLMGTGSIAISYPIDIGDFSVAATNSAIRIAAGATTSATKQNINMLGGNWNTGHHQLENGHIWNDATNNMIRFAGAAPAAETSGVGFLTAGETGAQVPTLTSNLPAAAAATASATWLPVYIGATKGWIPVWQ